MAGYLDWMAEARRIADAEVARAAKEFEKGGDVRYPCYSTIIDGHNPARELNGEMRVLYPAGRSVAGTLSAETVEAPEHGMIRYFTLAKVPREEIVLDVPKLRAQARLAAEGMAKCLMSVYGSEIDAQKFRKAMHMAMWNGRLRGEFARQFSEAAKAHPGKLETFMRHQHLVKCSDGEYRTVVM